MRSMLSTTRILNRKGVQGGKPYVGKVVDNNDPAQLSRVRVRVSPIHDGISDEDLHWSLPMEMLHPEGLKGGQAADRSGGQQRIPKKGHKVTLYFPTGNPAISAYSNRVPFDQNNLLPEFTKNYPYRHGFRLSNGSSEIYDTMANERYRTDAGDLYSTVLGDRFTTVVGNDQTIVTDSNSDIPDYVRSSPLSLDRINASPSKRIKFKGSGGSAGNKYLEVKGDLTIDVGGKIDIKSGKSFKAKIGTSTHWKSGGRIKHKGSRIDLN